MNIPYDGKLAIFTSFYSHYAYAPYVLSLAQTLGVLSKLGVNWDYLARPSDFHIERAINNTLTEVMERDDFTDVLLIDSDESWEPEGVVRLLLHPEEIVGASYRMKNQWETYVGRWKYSNGHPRRTDPADGKALLEATRVAAGFMRIKVSALSKWAAAYPELVSHEPDGPKVQFFSRMLDEGEMHCQDMAFCRRWLDIGGELWIDPNVKVNHWGMECRTSGDLDGSCAARRRTPTFRRRSHILRQKSAKKAA
jgi:hypothetical protein